MLQLHRQPVDLALTAQIALAPQAVFIPQPLAQFVFGNVQRVADGRDVTVLPVNLVERVDFVVKGIEPVHPLLLITC